MVAMVLLEMVIAAMAVVKVAMVRVALMATMSVLNLPIAIDDSVEYGCLKSLFVQIK